MPLSWDRPADPVEEAAHAASHLVGCALALAVWSSLAHPPGLDITSLPVAGSTLFVATMLLMFVASASYHAARPGPTKIRLRRLDHAVIFLFIAGSCTPFALEGPEPAEQWPLLAAVWSVALLGMALKLADRLRHRGWSTALYVVFGVVAGAAALPALQRVPPLTQALVLAGGLCYLVGCAFFVAGMRMRWGHLLWHLMVIVASTCHVAALMMAQ